MKICSGARREKGGQGGRSAARGKEAASSPRTRLVTAKSRSQSAAATSFAAGGAHPRRPGGTIVESTAPAALRCLLAAEISSERRAQRESAVASGDLS